MKLWIARSREKLAPDLIQALTRIVEFPSKIDAEDIVDDTAKDVIGNKMLCGWFLYGVPNAGISYYFTGLE